MMIRYQILNPTKLPAQCELFIISYQSEDLYQKIVTEICRQYQITEHRCYQISILEHWNTLSQHTQNYDLFHEPCCYEFELQKNGLACKTLPVLSPIQGDIYIFKTQQFKHQCLDKIATLPKSCWIQSYAPNVKDLWNYLKRQILPHTLSNEVESWFLQQHAIDFGVVEQAVEKIQLSQKNASCIVLDELKKHLSIQITEDWNPFLESWMNKELTLSLSRLQYAQLTGQELTLLIWLLNRNVQALYAIQQGIRPAKSIYEQFKIWPSQISLFEKALKHFSSNQLANLLTRLQDIDRLVKTGQTQLAWLKLHDFLLASAP
jgi:DNA polymerase III delta subunit